MSRFGKVVLQYVLVPLVCMIAYYLLISIALEIVRAFAGEGYMDYDYAIYTIEGIAGIVLCLVWFHIYKKYGYQEVPISKGKPEDWALASFAALAMLGVSVLYFMVVTRIHTPYVEKSLNEYNEMMEVTTKRSALGLFLSVFSSSVLIPILEEMVFRGIVFQGMLRVGEPISAILVSALCFGVMHGQVIQIGYAFLCGIFLAVVYYVSKNLVMTIFTHMLFNILGGGIYEIFNPPELMTYILMVVEFAAIPIFIVMVILLLVYRKKHEKKKAELASAEGKGEA